MTLKDVACLLDARLECCEEGVSIEITSVCASDLMSDVLAFGQPDSLLLTGLTNAQSIMTAEVADVVAVAYVRGKRPAQNVIELAREKGIPVLTTALSMFEACGKMYANGLIPGSNTKERQ